MVTVGRSTASLRRTAWQNALQLVLTCLVLVAVLRCTHPALAQTRPSAEPLLQHHDVRQVWNTSSGLPQDTVRQFLQTRDGFLWMATEGGLVRFDGSEFTVYDKRSAPSIHSDLANNLYEDAAGNLWIATAEGLTERSGNTFRRYTTQDGLPSDTIWAVGQDATGSIWVATAEGLAHQVKGRFEREPVSVDRPASGRFDGQMPSRILVALDQTLWAISTTTITHVGRDGLIARAALPSPAIAASVAADGTLWIATGQSLLRLDPHGAGGQISVASLPFPAASTPRCIALDPAGTLWLGTDNGLYASLTLPGRAQTWRHFQTADGLEGTHIAKLYADQSGTLWVVTEAGLARYSHGQFSSGYEQEGFKGKDVLALYQDHDGDLWAGSENSGAAIFRHSAFTTFTSREGLPTDVIRSLHSAAFQSDDSYRGDVWFGTASGLTRLHRGIFSNLTTAQGLASDEVLAIAPGTQPQSLWLGTPDGLSLLAGNLVTTLTASDGLPDDNIRSLLLARDHALWIGTSHGLARLPDADAAQAHAIRTYTQSDGLASDVIGSMLEDSDGSLWVGTLKGLSHVSFAPAGAHIRTYTASDGLTASTVTALDRDHTGRLWIGTSGGGLFTFIRGRIMRIGSETDYASGRLPAVLYGIVEGRHCPRVAQ